MWKVLLLQGDIPERGIPKPAQGPPHSAAPTQTGDRAPRASTPAQLAGSPRCSFPP